MEILMRNILEAKKGTQIIDLSAQERTAVMKPCLVCQKDVAVASDFQGPIFCSTKCQKEASDIESTLRDSLIRFADSESSFYRCPYNTEQLVEAFQSGRFTDWTVKGLRVIFQTLTAENQLLPKISLDDIKRMSPTEYAKREHLDPDLGGHKTAIEGGALLTQSQRRPVESAQPGFTPGNRLAALQRAAENELKQRASAHADRYATTAFRNGVPVKAPELHAGAVQYRNGRLVK
jgi:hypothetical protein